MSRARRTPASPLGPLEALEDRLTPSFPFLLPPPPVTLFAVGAGPGSAGGHVKVFNADGSLRFSFLAFPGFDGGVTVTTRNVIPDPVDHAVEDIVVGAGPGSVGGHVKVFDGADGRLVASFFTFPGFAGGVDVAVGDVNSDGRQDIIAATGPGAGHVKAFDLATGSELLSFLPYGDFRGGVSVAAGDFYPTTPGDEILTGVASGGPAHVKVFSAGLQELVSFIAYPGYLGGIDVATGALFSDLRGVPFNGQFVTAPREGTGGDVRFFAGPSGQPLNSFVPFPGQAGGLRLAVGRAPNGDQAPVADNIFVGPGRGGGSVVKAFHSVTLEEVYRFTAFEGFEGGVSVG
jgi:hypothetical protein